MKLRNKKTGAVANYSIILQRETGIANNEAPIRYGCGSLAKLNEDWEDYKPAEPFIKDPKILKAVRAWAEANDIKDGITYLGDGEFRSYLNTTIDFAILVDEHRFDLLKKSEEYTIAELCGEEEE